MIDSDFLYSYELKERSIIKRTQFISSKIPYATSSKELYPDIDINGGTVYLRGSVPLKLLLLLYDKIILFMPPANREYFENKYHLSFDDILTLCRKKIIIPLIAHPTDYKDDCFRDLFELNPPSVWSRGISLMNVFNMDFEAIQGRLPLKRIAAFASVRKQWRRHYPLVTEELLTENIVRELSTLCADLIVFGYDDIIDNLIDLKVPDYQLVNYLKTLNEILTYPYLFGLGGTPIFDYKDIKNISKYNFSIKETAFNEPEIVCPSLKYVLEDFEIYFNDLSIYQLIEYHNDHFAKKMRKAIMDLQQVSSSMLVKKSISIDEICNCADNLNFALEDFHKQVGSDISLAIKKTEKEVYNQISLGSVTLGNYLVHNTRGNNIDIAYLSNFNTLNAISLFPTDLQRIISSKVIAERFSPSVATLWEISNKIHKK